MTNKAIFFDNAVTRLTSPVSTSDTVLNITPGSGAFFTAPTAGQYATITLTDQGTGTINEITYLTGVTANTLTVIRAQEGTTAKAYAYNDFVGNLFTAMTAAKFAQDPSDKIGGVSAVQVYAGNPNGHIAGNAAVVGTSAPSAVWDTTNRVWWVCIGTGTTSTALWLATTTGAGVTFCGTSTGSANAQVLTPAVPVPAYGVGVAVSFIAGFTNTGALTINVSGLGARNVYKDGPSGPIPLTGGEVVAGNIISARDDGTRFQLTSTELGTAALANASSGTGILAAVTGSTVVGHIATFADTFGTIQDGGLPGVAAAPTILTQAANAGLTLGVGVYGSDTTTASGGAFNNLLPASPAHGACLIFKDLFLAWGLNNYTISRNGHTINGSATDLICNVNGYEDVQLTYNSATSDWKVS